MEKGPRPPEEEPGWTPQKERIAREYRENQPPPEIDIEIATYILLNDPWKDADSWAALARECHNDKQLAELLIEREKISKDLLEHRRFDREEMQSDIYILGNKIHERRRELGLED